GFLRETKTDWTNFIDWYRQLRIVLSIEDKLNYLEQPIPPALVVPAGQHVAPEILAAHNAWIKGSKEIADLMLTNMEPEIQQNLETLHAHEMLLELKTLFAQQTEHELLRKEFDGFVQNYNMHSLGKTINKLHAMLKLHEQTLPKNNTPALHAIRAGKVQKVNKHKKSQPQMAARGQNHGKGKNKQAYAPKPKIPPPPNRKDPAKDSICHECGETEHWKRNCPPYLAELLKKKKNAASGAGGSDGFINRFVNNTIQVSRNNMVYFSVIPRDGIFEIDLSNSYTNESSMYVVSNKRAKLDLDSTLLWHCRLGHISKKRIEKLQHDGLLDSTDLRAFEKCVSYMSGKMAMKPYTHQVERAKDLLGLIHTDVCGPFKIMSRQGASYFVTFTDDFSRYGYVYLLKHKHEVFETFKVFQKEVENQLGKTIKSLRSDREGEYMSQEFLDHLKDHGIIAHRTPPYTPQHNENSLINQKASESLEDLEIIQEEDAHPSIDTCLNHKDNDLEIDEPQSDIVPIRRSTRTRHAPDQKLKLSKSEGASTPAELKRMQNVPYALAVGDLKRELKVSCYTDAGYLTDADDLKSQTGYVFILNGGAVDWKSAKQSIFATSSAKAEYIAAFDASQDAVWVRKFISGLGVVLTIEEPISARHFRAKVHYLREVIEYSDIKLEKVHTYDNLADPFTKALAFLKYSKHTRNIGMLPASSLILPVTPCGNYVCLKRFEKWVGHGSAPG
nr:retrotransposon protein, putative, Ty1-copia subclass [Tanacetum cinerariifolium]